MQHNSFIEKRIHHSRDALHTPFMTTDSPMFTDRAYTIRPYLHIVLFELFSEGIAHSFIFIIGLFLIKRAINDTNTLIHRINVSFNIITNKSNTYFNIPDIGSIIFISHLSFIYNSIVYNKKTSYIFIFITLFSSAYLCVSAVKVFSIIF